MAKRKVRGVGINDATYPVICPFYSKWTGMLERAYGRRNPSYNDAEVCEEWHSFMAFRSWMINQDWQDKELDKDILGDGTLYSPETCCFVPKHINTLFNNCGAKRGEFPMGVTWHNGNKKFTAQCCTDGKQKRLGYFNSVDEAEAAYLEAKTDEVKRHAMTQPDNVGQAMLEKWSAYTETRIK